MSLIRQVLHAKTQNEKYTGSASTNNVRIKMAMQRELQTNNVWHLTNARQPYRERPSTIIKTITDYINELCFFDENDDPLFDDHDFPLPINDLRVMTANHLVLDAGGNIVVDPAHILAEAAAGHAGHAVPVVPAAEH